MNAEQTEIAEQKVARFVGRFGESYRLLAYYAALPLVLTPELLNYLRNHFLRGKTPWVAEVDLLLSELCRPVGYEQFVMASDVRAYLLGEMRKRFGEASMQEVARLLIQYVHQLSRRHSPFSPDELEAEQWSAMVYLDERRGEAAQQIAESFRDRFTAITNPPDDVRALVPEAELNRLVRITKELEGQLRAFPELLRYAEDVGQVLDSPGMLARARRRPVPKGTVKVGDVALPDVKRWVGLEPPEPDDGQGAPAKNPIPFRDGFIDGRAKGPEMVWLPGGSFRMGDEREKSVHEVELSHFSVGKYPVPYLFTRCIL